MPLTFGTPPKLVQAIMAGGQEAVFKTREGVEDNFEEGARSMARLRVSRRDAVIGVSASGLTQFVRGALTGARKKGARIIFVTCWPGTELQNYVDLIIAPAVGPGGHCRIHAAQGRNRDEDGAQHAHDHRDDPRRQDLRQPHGGRPDRVREAARPCVPDRGHRDGHRSRRGGRVAAHRSVEREGRDRHEESRRSAIRRRSAGSAPPTIPFAPLSARTSSPRSADSLASTDPDFSAARALIAGAIDQGVTPAAVVEVGRAAGPIWCEPFGRLWYDAAAPAADVRHHVRSGVVDESHGDHVARDASRRRTTSRRSRPASERSSRDGVTPRTLQSGCAICSNTRPVCPRTCDCGSRRSGRAEYEAALQAVPLERPPGAESVYSDLGFMVLGFALETARGARARRAVRGTSHGLERDDDVQAVADAG